MSTLHPSLIAGLLLAAISFLKKLGLAAPTAAEVLSATGAGRSTAYKFKRVIEALLPDLARPPGRPAASASVPPPGALGDLQRQVLTFVYDHPGVVGGSGARRRYSPAFHEFVLDLWEAHHDLGPELFARAIQVPLPTLKDWLRGERPQVGPPVEPPAAGESAPELTHPHIEAILSAWEGWADKRRGFSAFCKHVRLQLGLPVGHHFIRDVLHAAGLRIPKKRGRQPDASVNRRGFETFFPGAQWTADGTQVIVEVNGHRFYINLELMVDAASGAFTGASIRPTEDAEAVIQAFTDAVETTGAPPLAVLLDNKPSNHCDAVAEALGDSLCMRSRSNVPTDKPHVEGAFGLFAQEAPPLLINAATPEQLAQQLAALVITAWARAVNHRPRADRGGKSRAGLYCGASPTPEERAQAYAHLLERQRRQEKAREARRRRRDPLARAALDAAFARLGLEDPDHRLRDIIAAWPLEAIINGIAVFEGKREAGTLPAGADGRYLRGIVKNLAQQAEGWKIAEALLRERMATREFALSLLGRKRGAIEQTSSDAATLIKAFIAEALAAGHRIDRIFWLLAVADLISEAPAEHHPTMLGLAARRMHAASATPHRERLAATRFLFAKVLPID